MQEKQTGQRRRVQERHLTEVEVEIAQVVLLSEQLRCNLNEIIGAFGNRGRRWFARGLTAARW